MQPSTTRESHSGDGLTTSALEARGLHKRYRDRDVVRGVDLVVRAGEVHGLLGPNGAGKTTLLRMLLGLVRPDAGVVRLLGEPAGAWGDRLPSGVRGFVDSPRFYPYLSGRKNLHVLARLDGTASSSGDARRVRRALEEVGLEEHADKKFGDYSAGMRQRLGLASTLLSSPRLILLDEPTSALDPAGARDLRILVRRLAKDGAAVVWSSHDMGEVEDLCQALTILHRGRVAFAGSLRELRKQAQGRVHRLRTGDDARALQIAKDQPDLQIAEAADGEGLEVYGSEPTLDRYVVRLGQAGIAIRSLESRERSLQSLFLRLTADSEKQLPEPSSSALSPLVDSARGSRSRQMSLGGLLASMGAEWVKIGAQWKAWAVGSICLLGPVAFVVSIRAESATPEDTLFGRWVTTSGFAVPLVVLGFAASWALPALTSIIGGDLFSAEDRYGTWSTLLTRGGSRREIFAGKTLTALTFSAIAVLILAASSIGAGLVVIGRQPLLGLSGTLLPPERSLVLTLGAWASVGLPVFAFTTMSILISVATRSSTAGVGLPVCIGLVMQLLSYVNGPRVIDRVLLTSPLVAWHGLFTEHRYYGPLIWGAWTSAVYLIACLSVAATLMQRRDMSG